MYYGDHLHMFGYEHENKMNHLEDFDLRNLFSFVLREWYWHNTQEIGEKVSDMS